MMKQNVVLKVLPVVICLVLWCSSNEAKLNLNLPLVEHNEALSPISEMYTNDSTIEWVEQTLSQMSLEEKIGQLMMVAAYSTKGESHVKDIKSLVQRYQLGGLIFFKGEPTKQVEQTNLYQSVSKTPMLIAIDGEWGLSMRLDSTVQYPRQLMLGALQDNSLIYEMGKQVAQQCKRMGIHINFAPVVDVNNNPNNPVINDRSFGEEKYNVSSKGISYMRGMQENGIMACAKHFPGHGDTNVDSHKDLPVIGHGIDRLRNVEFFPFKEMIRNGLQSMMVAHLNIPALDATPNQASTLSKPIVTNLLRKEMGFSGLVFTDALNMQGVAKYYAAGETEVKAFMAGNDVLLFPTDVGKAIEAMKTAVLNGSITQARLDESVRRILKAKFFLGLKEFTPIETNNLTTDLNKISYDLLNRKLAEKAMTLVENNKNIVPLKNLENLKIATLNIGDKANNIFQKTLGYYAPVDHYFLKKNSTANEKQNLQNALRGYNLVIISMHEMSRYAHKNFGLKQENIDLIQQISQQLETILVVHGSPYSLAKFPNQNTLVCSYEDNPLNQQMAAMLIFGAVGADGALPVTASQAYYFGKSVKTKGGLRLKYTVPEEVGLNRFDFTEVDNIVNEAISDKATPGCVVLMAKDGKVIFYKSYGHHTYDKKELVHPADIYDLASITKVCATNLSLMNLEEQGKISIDKPLGKYLSKVKKSNKADLKIKDILIHESGLVSWIPFYINTIDEDGELLDQYKKTPTGSYKIKVAENLFMNQNYVTEMWDTIRTSELLNEGKYKYSDLGYYMFHEMIEEQTKAPLEVYTNRNFYRPLGLSTMGFNPLDKFRKEYIVPTEKDEYFRNQLLHGYVHDMGAAMLGGVSGHAGLFSNANDVAVIFQMLLNKGTYGGQRYFKPETIEKFTSIQKENNRRGLGFDKPNLEDLENSPCCEAATPQTFGHTGFTGTGAWVDPVHNVVYIFLSNRVHPDMTNNKLFKDDIRTRIQQVMYDALDNAGMR